MFLLVWVIAGICFATIIKPNRGEQKTIAKASDESSLTGTLSSIKPGYTGSQEDSFILGEKGYWLTLDSPIIFNEGSKSERVVKGVRLTVPADLEEKASELEDQHVVVTGQMNCTMHYSPWTASCEMLVTQIDLAE